MSQKKQNFEESLTELEQIVGKLEDGDLALEESLELFEKGVKISRECQARLTEAERRIEVLIKDRSGKLVLESLDEAKQIESVEVETYQKIIVENGNARRSIIEDEEADDIPF
jgi:exodeoxyribonuclease VII small subunit